MKSSPILDAHDAANPAPWWRRRRTPTALELAVVALQECRRDQLHHTQLSEYHTAMMRMLSDRDKRLQKDIDRLSRAAQDPVVQEHVDPTK